MTRELDALHAGEPMRDSLEPTTAPEQQGEPLSLVDRLRADASAIETTDVWPETVALLREAASAIETASLTEEGSKEAFRAVVEQKRTSEAECTRLRTLLDAAHDQIRRAKPRVVVADPRNVYDD